MNLKDKRIELLILIAMLYITVDLASMVFAYKIIKVGSIIGAASSLIFPLTYSIMDLITEVYGYKIAQRMIWYGFFCDLIFGILALSISCIPSINEQQTAAYVMVLGTLLRAVAAQTLGVLTGALINIHLISKWKKLTNGKYFWLRSIGSSCIGEAIMLIVSVLIALGGILPFATLIRLIIYTYLYKILFAVMISPLLNITATLLKVVTENHLPYDNFNPFCKSNIQDEVAIAPIS